VLEDVTHRWKDQTRCIWLRANETQMPNGKETFRPSFPSIEPSRPFDQERPQVRVDAPIARFGAFKWGAVVAFFAAAARLSR
jgi:hypothetical protein